MKNILKTLIFCSLAVIMSSCLTMGLEDLPEFEGADITSVNAVRYRYITGDKIPGTDEYLVKDIDLGIESVINAEDATVTIKASKRDGFPEDQLDNLSRSNLVVAVTLSTAARIKPINGSTPLGLPGDWSKPNTYEVQAADGTKKVWTIEITELKK